jgi:serine/threonine protein kinase
MVLCWTHLAGTLDYMAPEVLRCPLKRHPGDNKDRADLHYATAVDAWAVGVLAYELLTGRWALQQ